MSRSSKTRRWVGWERRGSPPRGRPAEEIAAYFRVIDSYADDPALGEQVAATALYNKGVRLGALDRPAEEIAAYDRVIDTYADDPLLAEVVERAEQGRARALK